MITVSPGLASILRTATRAPRVYMQVQLPLITNAATNTVDFSKLGSSLWLDQFTSIRRQSTLAAASDTLDAEMSNDGQMFSPLSTSSPLGRYFYPGPVDNKYWLWMGLNADTSSIPGSSPNLIVVSDTLSGAVLGGSMALGTGGPNNSNDAEYIGNGSAAGSFESIVVSASVAMGQTYVNSWWIDPSQVTNIGSNVVSFGIEDINSTVITSSSVASSTIGRFATGAWTCPQNIYANSDSLSGSTLTGLTQGTGGPGGATDAEYTGNGIVTTSNKTLSDTISVTIGQVLAFSAWIDPSQIFISSGGPILNPNDCSAQITLTGGDLVMTVSAAFGGNAAVRGVEAVSSGKWYWEVAVTTIGIGTSSATLDFPGSGAGSWGYQSNGTKKLAGAAAQGYGATFTTGDVLGFAMDMNAGTLTCYKNNVSQGVMVSGLSGTIFPMLSSTKNGVNTARFDSSTFSYTAPNGFSPLPKAFIQLADTSGHILTRYPLTSSDTTAKRYATPAWTATVSSVVASVQLTAGAIVSSGQKFKVSQPMIEQSSSASGYYISSSNPQVHVYAELLPSAIVTNGQKFKVSQPMLTTSNWDPMQYVPWTPAVSSSPTNQSLGVVYGAETILPKGVYLLETTPQDSENGESTLSISCVDQWSMFKGNVYAQFPPRLYGIQDSSYYNPNYALNNPSGDLKTYVCDAKNWAQSSTCPPVWKADVPSGDVVVYTSDINGGNSPTTHSYTVDYHNAIITFTNSLPANTTVSVDARPLSMSPELMLYHLFVDFGSFSPDFLKFDQSGILLPIMENARDRAILDVAQEIASQTAPKGVVWKLYFDASGYLVFTEPNIESGPVKTLEDYKDILSIKPELSSRDIKNVVRAQATSNNNQPIEVVSLSQQSISIYSQRPTYDIPSQLLTTVIGMESGAAMTYMNTLTWSQLFQSWAPVVSTEIEVMPDPSIESGDVIDVRDSSTGMIMPNLITQITDEVLAPDWKQTYIIEQIRNTQDFQYGLSYYAGSPEPQNSNQIQAMSSLIQSVTLNGTSVVTGGQPVLDSTMEPVVPIWDPTTSLPVSITLAQTTGSSVPSATTYIWRYMYICEDVYSNGVLVTGDAFNTVYSGWPSFYPESPSQDMQLDLTGLVFGGAPGPSGTYPYDVRCNFDTVRSRRFFWPLLRCSDWVTHDGVTGYSGDSPTTLASTWTGGVGSTNPNIYGNLRVNMTDYYNNTTSGFKGVSLWGDGTPSATILGQSSTTKFGVDFGVGISGTVYAGIKKKQTPARLVIIAASTLGVVQYKKIPFIVQTA